MTDTAETRGAAGTVAAARVTDAARTTAAARATDAARTAGAAEGATHALFGLTIALAACLAVALALLGSPTRALAVEGEPQLTEAQAAIVEDSAGNVLFSKNPDAEINMASVTKIMTAVVALESGVPLDTQVTMSPPVLQENALVAGYQAGQTSSLEDLMRVMLVRSANDAAYEVAVACAGSEEAFVQKMNDKAAELGMTHTQFQNSHGLDAEGHYSSVADLVTLGRYAMTNYPFISDTVRLSEVTAPVGSVDVTFHTVDRFVETYPGALGIKTGTGNEVTSFLGSARRDGVTLYTCVLGCETSAGRFADTESLMDWAFDNYDRYRLANANTIVRVEPFAYHFGLSVVVTADASLTGMVWPDGGDTTWRAISPERGLLIEPGQQVSACQWTQDGRTVGTATYSSRSALVPTSSGFGLLDQSVRARDALVRRAALSPETSPQDAQAAARVSSGRAA